MKHNLTFDLFKKAFLGNEPHFTWGSALTLQPSPLLGTATCLGEQGRFSPAASWAGHNISTCLAISKIEAKHSSNQLEKLEAVKAV